MLGEMVVDFRTAVKRSVVDYILRSPVERRRVNILHPPRAGESTTPKSCQFFIWRDQFKLDICTFLDILWGKVG
jgi:hypothetical protein